MLNAFILCSSALVVVCLAFCLPLPLTASTAAGCLLAACIRWLFSGYRNVLEGKKTSGSITKLNMSRSGLFDGFSPRAHPLGDGKAVYSPEGDRRLIRPVSDRSTDSYRSPSVRLHESTVYHDSRTKTPVVSTPVSPMSRSGLLDGFSPGNYPIFSPSGRLNVPSDVYGRPSDTDSFLGSQLSPRERSMCRVSKPQSDIPVSSPSVSPLYRSSSSENHSFDGENRVIPPVLPPGSYPWLMPPGGPSANKSGIEVVSVKMRLSKPNSSFAVASPDVSIEESPKAQADKTKEIIQALKALSKKRTHSVESDEIREQLLQQDTMVKRRPTDVFHNLYGSTLRGTAEAIADSPLREEILSKRSPESTLLNQPVHHLDSPPPQPHSAVPPHLYLPNNAARQQQQQLLNNGTYSNKRPRPASDSGNQTAKKRYYSEIFASLSSSVAMLNPQLLQGSLKRKNHEKDVQSMIQKKQRNKETSCVEVQTLPSPIAQDDQSKDKEDKGTATDRTSDDESHERRRNKTVVTEKKVTANMAAALLRSAMIKLASSGDIIPAGTLQTGNPASDETPASKGDSVTVAATEATTAGAFVFNQAKTSSDKIDSPQTGGLPKFGMTSTLGESAPGATAAAAVATPAATTQASVQPSAQATGFTLAGFPKPPALSGSFEFGSGAVRKEDAPKSDPKPAEPTPVNQNTFTFGSPKPGGFSFGATTSAATVPVASVAPSTIASTAGFTLGQHTQPAASAFGQATASTAPVMFGQSSKPAATSTITFGQTQPASTTNTQAGANTVITFGQPPKPSTGQPSGFSLGATTSATTVTSAATSSKPGGFSFTPSTSFSMGSSPTSTSTSTSQAPIFSLGSNGFGQKPDGGSSLFGMPRPAASVPSSAPEPPKSFGGFNFSSSTTKSPAPSLFPSATPQNPEQKTAGGFSGFGQSSEPSKTFSLGSTAGAAEPAKAGSPFTFGASAPAPAPPGTTGTSTPAFNSPAAAGTNLFGPTSAPSAGFGSTTPKATPSFSAPASGFGATPNFGSVATTQAPVFGASSTTQAPVFGASSTTQAPVFGASSTTQASAFGAPSTTQPPAFGAVSTAQAPTFGAGSTSQAPAFGAPSTTQPPTFGASSTAQTPAFGAATRQTTGFGTATTAFGATAPSFGAPATTAAPTFGSAALSFGSTTPAFGSATPAFGSTTPAFGSGSSTFGAAQPTFGSVASTSGPTSTPAFGSSPATTTSSMFGSGAFGSPAFGSSAAAPTFGASASSTPAPAPAFGASQTTAAPAFGATPSPAAPFSFSAPTTPAGGGFAFTAPQPTPPANMFQFGSSGAAAPQPGAQQPFAFGGGQAPAPGGFQNTMFSIGSGSSAPRSRTALRTRKK